MGVPAQAVPRNLTRCQAAWRRPAFVREVGPQGYLFRTPYGVRGMSDTMYVTLEYPRTAGKWGYLLHVLNILPYRSGRVQIILRIRYYSGN